jgi:ferredoxin-NADP reductase
MTCSLSEKSNTKHNRPRGTQLLLLLLLLLQEGDTIDVKGPYGKFHYEGQGRYTLNR